MGKKNTKYSKNLKNMLTKTTKKYAKSNKTLAIFQKTRKISVGKMTKQHQNMKITGRR